MSSGRTEDVLEPAGPAAPPRKNGELVFAAPWESRIFGVTLALYEARVFEWEEFRHRLIAEIAEPERDAAAWSYYACWAVALEKLLATKGLCGIPELDARERELAARPAGHDHAGVGGEQR
jgi:nitrile hydratase accessory protein